MGDDRSMTGRTLTFGRADFTVEALRAAKRGHSVSVCIPSRNEERTVGSVVAAIAGPHVRALGGSGLVDEILVVDDGSGDATADVARRAGARVISRVGDGGKGEAMRAGLAEAEGDLVVFLDADVENTDPGFVTCLVGPLLLRPDVAMVKGFYDRPLHGNPDGGGRVTELVARPLIDLLFPALSPIRQPLAGETAAPRAVLEKVGLAGGYGVELALLVDVARQFGPESVVQVDLGVRVHRNRPLQELRPQASEILRTALQRAGLDPDEAAGRLGERPPEGEAGR
jgi:glucosyl-3-phosphoglycerate synthase